MLNEEKVKLMARMAIYEKRQGKKAMKFTKYFHSDYVSWNVIKTVFAITISYMLVTGCWVLYHMEYYLENLYTLDFTRPVKDLLTGYVVLLVSYVVLSYIVYSVKYSMAMKSLKNFRLKLRKVRQMDQDDAKGGES